jgi:sulfur-oxidizing protein SoxX
VRHRLTLTVLIFASVLVCGPVIADVAPDEVQIKDGEVSKSLSGNAGDSKAGKKWFVGRKLGNCLACHQNPDVQDEPFHGEVGTPLGGVGSRYSEAQLRAILVNSKAVFGEQTMMPAFYKKTGLNRVLKTFENKTILSAQQVEDMIAYLKTLKE